MAHVDSKDSIKLMSTASTIVPGPHTPHPHDYPAPGHFMANGNGYARSAAEGHDTPPGAGCGCWLPRPVRVA
jgi:hypothetical protein